MTHGVRLVNIDGAWTSESERSQMEADAAGAVEGSAAATLIDELPAQAYDFNDPWWTDQGGLYFFALVPGTSLSNAPWTPTAVMYAIQVERFIKDEESPTNYVNRIEVKSNEWPTWTEEWVREGTDALEVSIDPWTRKWTDKNVLPMRMVSPYVSGQAVVAGSVVHSRGILMHANKDTSDPAAPPHVGLPRDVYQGASPTGQISAKELRIAQRYTNASAYWLNSYAVYTVSGNHYRTYVVVDPDGVNQIEPLHLWTANSTGWQVRTIAPRLVVAGTAFELWAALTEPDPVPTTIEATWDYITPNHAAIPASGEIKHANKAVNSLRVHKTPWSGGPVDLSAVLPGDIIHGPGGIRWSVQAVSDEGTYWDFTIAPALQGSPAGTFLFVFETVTTAPITTVIDPDYFSGDAEVDGRYVVDSGSEVVTNDAYGVNINVQEVNLSLDWDYMMSSS